MPYPPYFNRAWQLTIDTADGNHYRVRSLVASDEEPLRISFNTTAYIQQSYWLADITVYNLRHQKAPLGHQDEATELTCDQRILSGDVVSLSAGYDDGHGSFSATKGLIFAGRVFQPVWTRQNVVDYTLKLRCICGLTEDTLNLLSFAKSAGATHYATLEDAVTRAGAKLDIDARAAEALQNTTYGRAQVFHTKPDDLVREITKQSNLFFWNTPAVGPDGKSTVMVRSFVDRPTTPDLMYGPSGYDPNEATGFDLAAATVPGLKALRASALRPTLIGTPEQTQDGVRFRVLIDSDIRIGAVIQLAKGTILNPFLMAPLKTYPQVSAREGLFVVAGYSHVGDSRGRGGDWYTEVTGLLWNFFPSLFAANTPS